MKVNLIRKIIVITLIIILIFPYSTTLAADVATVGNAIGAFALNYARNKGTSQYPYVHYESNNYAANRALRNGGPTLFADGSYRLECVGWVNFCVYNATGIEEEVVMNGSSGYVVPKVCNSALDRPNFEIVNIGGSELSALQTGDIVITQTHVMVYANDGGTPMFIHSIGKNGPALETYDQLYSNYKGKLKARARVKESTAAAIDESQLKTDPSLLGGSSSSSFAQSEFFYNGIPDGKYSVTAGIEDFLVGSLADVLDYIIGIMTLSQRMSFVGWASIIENMITNTVNNLDSTADNDGVKEQDPTSYEVEEDTVTIESIVFNRLNIFNVNFFQDPSANAEVEETEADVDVDVDVDM